ncbi:MAG: ATP-binding protein [bacterium]|nr:ATP-binding protein [bacterium]
MAFGFLALLAAISFVLTGIFLWKYLMLRVAMKKRESSMSHQLYELAVLKELGDRIGYSLNVQNIVDVITGSLHQFINYSAVSYMLIEPEKIRFKIHLEQSVSRPFIDEVRDRMLKSLSALLNREFDKFQVEEVLSGAVLIEEVNEPVRSFFNIPLSIGEQVVGVITVAHTQSGLYREEEMNILYKITRQASQAVSRLEEVVKTEERKLNAMVESITDGVVMADQDYRLVVVNPAAKRVAGISEKADPTIFDFIDHLAGAFDIRGRLEESIKLDKVIVVPEVMLSNRFFQIVVSPVKASVGMRRGEVLGSLVLFHDITSEKEIERLREEFTSMMVHELRSPLDGIRKISERIRAPRKRIAAKETREYGQLIFQSSSRILELVNDLLDAARIEAGKFEIFPEPHAPRALLEESLAFYRLTAEDAKLSFTLKTGVLPDTVHCDRVRIQQVLGNLLSNAIKFTSAGGSIEIQAIRHQNGKDLAEEAAEAGIRWFIDTAKQHWKTMPNVLVIAVTDSGIGLSDAQVGQLFNKFKQFKETALSAQKGTGLGLVIAKGIVEAHEGQIGVGSTAGKGSTFYFTLPLQ